MPHAATRLVALATAGALATLLPVSTASASRGNSNRKQTICHATHSDTNPYVVITPNKNGDVDGHAKHTGPIWDSTLKAQHIAWGDIIPPFAYNDHGTPAQYPGQNWTEQGQAIFANGCAVPTGGGGGGTTGGSTGATTGTTTGGGGGGTTGDVTAPGSGSGSAFTGGGGAVAAPAATPSGSGGAGGSGLPFTGMPLLEVLAAGLASAAGGALLLLVTHRRRAL